MATVNASVRGQIGVSGSGGMESERLSVIVLSAALGVLLWPLESLPGNDWDTPRLCDSTIGVAGSAGDNSEEEITPYLNRSANARVRRDMRSEGNNELRACSTLWRHRRESGEKDMGIYSTRR